MKQFSELVKDKEDNKEHYSKVKKLKKPKINELEKIISKAIKKDSYAKFTFSKPDFGRHVTVEFTVEDSLSKRKEYDSRSTLKKLLISNLKDTNWRLMSEGISYRLGYLRGRIKGYEDEKELMELVKKNR